jgi:SAM-dependent methyltransferase
MVGAALPPSRLGYANTSPYRGSELMTSPPPDIEPTLEDFYSDCLSRGEVCSQEVEQILKAGRLISHFDTRLEEKCRQEFQRALVANDGRYEVLILALEEFFEAQRSKKNLGFDEVVQNIYCKSYYPIAEHLIYAFPYGQKRAEVILRYCNRALRSMTDRRLILDVGAGPGVIARELCGRHENSTVNLVDVSLSCLKYARRALKDYLNARDFLYSDFRDLVLSHQYPLVVASEVVEHVADPIVALHQLRSFVAPKGALVLGVPINLPMTMHLTVFESVESVLHLADKAGFDVIDGHIYPLYSDSVDLTLLLHRR